MSEQEYRRKLVEHGDAVKAALDAADPRVAAFIRTNYRLDLYPLDFTTDMIAKLTALITAAPSSQATGEAPEISFDEVDGILRGLADMQAGRVVSLESIDGKRVRGLKAAPSSSPALSGQTKDDDKH